MRWRQGPTGFVGITSSSLFEQPHPVCCGRFLHCGALKLCALFAIWSDIGEAVASQFLALPMGILLSSESTAKSDAPSAGDWRWGVFGNVAFTVMLIASSASNVGFAMFDTSSNWLMTSLNPDPMMVSAVQVATTLPMFLLTLPAGVLTDIIDARRMLIGAQIAVTAISIVFATIVAMHWATPTVLLATAFGVAGHHADAGAETRSG
jgi:Transmembrane secretion effector